MAVYILFAGCILSNRLHDICIMMKPHEGDSHSDSESQPLLDSSGSSIVNIGASEQRTSNRNLFLASAAMLLGSLCLGITLGMSSPMIPDMQKDESSEALDLSDSDISWFGSVMTLGAMTGGLLGGFLIQFFGRKLTAMICGLPFVGGMLLMAYAKNVPMLLAGRTITGFAGGVASLVVPTYISETSTTSLRGLLGSANQLSITLGILLSYSFGIFLTWRWLAIVAAVPCAMLTIFTALIPETPRYLLTLRKRRESRHSLAFLRGRSADVESELKELEESLGRLVGSASWLEVFSQKEIRTPLLLSLGVMFFQQFSGINCVMFYSETIFRNAGFSSDAMVNAALIMLASIQVLFTGISCVIMDKVGRKILLCLSGAVMAVSCGTFGLYFQLTSKNNATDPGLMVEELSSSTSSSNLNWLALTSLLVYIAAFAMGLGPIPWLLLAEIIPVRARGKASGLSTATNWALAFLVTKEFSDMTKAFTTKGTYWMFSGICIIGVLYHWLLLPETKGKTLEQISAHFRGRSHSRLSRDDSDEND